MDESQAQRGHEPQAAGQPAIPIEVLQDRYHGLTGTCKGSWDSRLVLRLIRDLQRLVQGTARVEDIAEVNDLSEIVDDCLGYIGQQVVARVHESGMAR
jgi:hypothetical protein